jgi:hypothetical protein
MMECQVSNHAEEIEIIYMKRCVTSPLLPVSL